MRASPASSRDTEGETLCSSHGFYIPGPWRCVALEHKGPLIFPKSTSKRQGGPDACGFKLLNSNEVSPACSCPAGTPARKGPPFPTAPCRTQCVGRARVHQAPVWFLALFTVNFCASKHQRLPRTPRMPFTSSTSCIVFIFSLPLPGAESKLIRGGG